MNNLDNHSDVAARAMRARGFRVVSRGQVSLRSEPGKPTTNLLANPPCAESSLVAAEFSRWRAAGGAVFGASVPVSVFTVSQLVPPETMLDTWRNFGLWVAVLGGLVFSAGTVYAYGCTVFRDPATRSSKKWKAASFCLLAETIMTLAPSMFLPLQVAMLAILVLSNAVETGRNAGAQ